jgi:hypothetical protein
VTPTTEKALAVLFRDAISGITPRELYRTNDGWQPHDRAESGPNRNRRFRLEFEAVGIFPGGAMAGAAIEHEATLRVRTSYTGNHAESQFSKIDDLYQLRDTLSALKSSANGLMLVSALRIEQTSTTEDNAEIDHVLSVRFMRNAQL